MCGTRIKLNTIYHPKIYGQIEWTNKTIGDMLQMYAGRRQHSWNKWLYLGEFAYNQRLHSNIGCSPLFTSYMHDYKTPMTISTRTQGLKVLIKWFKKWMKSLNLLNWSWGMLNIEPSTMQIKRSFREFKVGDKIFWKVTP
jgi:hypothetical protein